MTFQNPEFLLLLPIALIIFLLFKKFGKGGKESFVVFSNFGKMRKNASMGYLIPRIFDIAAFIVLTMALARPVALDKVISPPVEGKEIMIALDVSGSMEALDFKPKNRLEAAKRVISQFVEGRKTDRLGLVFFAADSFLQVPLTSDYKIFKTLLSKLKTGVIQDGTAIGNGLGLALSRLEDSRAKSKLIILLTDGDNNSGNLSPENAAELAKNSGVKIYPILIGTSGKVPFPAGKDLFGRTRYREVKMNVNPALMKKLSQVSGGKFFNSINTKDLELAFSKIDKLEKSPLQGKKFKLYKEFAPIFMLIGVILLLLSRVSALIFPVFPEVER